MAQHRSPTNSHICPPPSLAVDRIWCYTHCRSTASRWETSCVGRSRVRQSLKGLPGPRCVCAGTSAGTRTDTLQSSSSPRTSSARWSSPSRTPRSQQSADSDSTASLQTFRRSSDRWCALSCVSGRPLYTVQRMEPAQNGNHCQHP